MQPENSPPKLDDDTEDRTLLAAALSRKTKIFLTLSSIVLLFGSLFVESMFMPLPLVNIEGYKVCPTNYADFKGLCHFHEFAAGNYWKSKVDGLTPASSLILIGAKAFRDTAISSGPAKFSLVYDTTVTPESNGSINIIKKYEHKDSMVEINCKNNAAICDTTVLLTYNFLEQSEYLFELNFKLDQSNEKVFEGVDLFVLTLNPAFTTFLVVFRIFLFFFSGIFFIYFIVHLNNFKQHITLEQKLISILSAGLLIYNNPLYVVSMFRPSLMASFISDVCNAFFISLLICYWLFMTDRIISKNDQPFSAPLVTCFIALMGLLLSSGFYLSYISRFDPAYHLGTKHPLTFKILVAIVGSFVGALLLVLLARFYKITKVFGNTSARHRMFLFSSVILMVSYTVFYLTSFARSIVISSTQIFTMLIIANFYVLSLQYLWRFNPKSFDQSKNVIQNNNEDMRIKPGFQPAEDSGTGDSIKKSDTIH